MENKIKHLEFIQANISRMASNSFTIKSWTVGIITAIFAFDLSESSQSIILVSFFPIIIFAILDIYYLYNERLFIQLYNQVADSDESDINFKIVISKELKSAEKVSRSIVSPSIVYFYIPLILLVVAFYFFIN